MFVKEHEYDEFVAEKIKEAREDISTGKYITLEETKTRMKETIQKASKELERVRVANG